MLHTMEYTLKQYYNSGITLLNCPPPPSDFGLSEILGRASETLLRENSRTRHRRFTTTVIILRWSRSQLLQDSTAQRSCFMWTSFGTPGNVLGLSLVPGIQFLDSNVHPTVFFSAVYSSSVTFTTYLDGAGDILWEEAFNRVFFKTWSVYMPRVICIVGLSGEGRESVRRSSAGSNNSKYSLVMIHGVPKEIFSDCQSSPALD